MKLPPLPVRIVVAVIVLGSFAYFGIRSLNGTDNGALTASGSIEATIVNIAPEMAGKVTQVLADEGKFVTKDSALLFLDPSLLTAQQAVASAQVDSAKAALNTARYAYDNAQEQYNTTLSNALASDKATRTTVWKDLKPFEFDQPVWFFSKEERMKAAQSEVDLTEKALQDALQRLDYIQKKAGSDQFLEFEATLAQERIAFQNAKDVYDLTSGASDSQLLRDAAQIILDEAKIDLDDAQKDYEDELSTDDTNNVLEARADVVLAQEIHDASVDRLRVLQTGADSLSVLTAGKAVDQAKAALEQAQANVYTAQASLALHDTQIEKLTVSAPMDGVLLNRNVEPGEFVQPGAIAFTMADLSRITITVYVPEVLYGQVSLGQKANVSVDSFPGETFSASVVLISDHAEFTPRNVQTVEGRGSTFYAIKLKVDNIDGKLKIGMPADVAFK